MNRVRKRISDNVLVRLCKKLFLLLLIIGIPVVILLSTFHIKKLDVVGVNRYTPEQISGQLMKTPLDHNSLYLFLKYRYVTKVNLPFVEKVDVVMNDTHSVTAYVYEKMIAGCIEFMGAYMYFDKDGIIVESSTERLSDVPIIKGLKYDRIILSEKLKVQKDELFDVIINMTQLIGKYKVDVDVVSFSDNYEVTLECGNVTVLLGKKSTYDEALSALHNILAEVGDRKITINMRNYVKGTEIIIGKSKKLTE